MIGRCQLSYHQVQKSARAGALTKNGLKFDIRVGAVLLCAKAAPRAHTPSVRVRAFVCVCVRARVCVRGNGCGADACVPPPPPSPVSTTALFDTHRTETFPVERIDVPVC